MLIDDLRYKFFLVWIEHLSRNLWMRLAWLSDIGICV